MPQHFGCHFTTDNSISPSEQQESKQSMKTAARLMTDPRVHEGTVLNPREWLAADTSHGLDVWVHIRHGTPIL